jgi:8-oxo-dGTP diphosphatase
MVKKRVMIDVVCGIIFKSGKVFIARRRPDKSLGGYWEFPGGKIELEETNEEGLKRELREELGMEVEVTTFIAENEHEYDTFKIRLIAYHCKFQSATMNMTDHDAFEWVSIQDLEHYRLAPADIPLIQYVRLL